MGFPPPPPSVESFFTRATPVPQARLYRRPPRLYPTLPLCRRPRPRRRRPHKPHRRPDAVRPPPPRLCSPAHPPTHRTPIYHLRPPNSPDWAATPLAALLNLFSAYTSPVTFNALPFIPGGGLTRRLLAAVPAACPPTAALLQFALEGDNRADAALFAAVVAKALRLDRHFAEWRQPSSWKVGLFGTPQDQTLYG